jgi:hypothetical protein
MSVPTSATEPSLSPTPRRSGASLARRLFAFGSVLVASAGLAYVPATAAGASPSATTLLNNTNVYGVDNGPRYSPGFTLSQPTVITQIETYHWDNGQGTKPLNGPGSPVGGLGLFTGSGAQVLWAPAYGSSGQGNAPNVNWVANVTSGTTLPAGTYYVADSQPSTWSANAQSGYAGFAEVYGYALPTTTPTTAPPVTAPQSAPPASRYPFVPCAPSSASPVQIGDGYVGPGAGSCHGAVGTTLVIKIVKPLSSPIVRLVFRDGNATSAVTVNGDNGASPAAAAANYSWWQNNVAVGTYYTFPVAPTFCLAAGSVSYEVGGWTAAGLAANPGSRWGDLGEFGQFTVTGCP